MGNIFTVQISCDAFFNRCLDCTGKNAANVAELRDNLADLKAAMQELITKRNVLLKDVEDAEKTQPHMERALEVKRWLSDVQRLEEEVGKIREAKLEGLHKFCLGGCCAKNCNTNLNGRDVARKQKKVSELKEAGKFEELVRRIRRDLVDEMPMDPIIVGQKPTFDQVWERLRGNEVGIIGLYGTGGVGKTTLLTQIHNNFRKEPLNFDAVIWVVVSREPKREKIQDDIWKVIGSSDETWKDKSPKEKAKEIFLILSRKKYVLLLDDIWHRIDLTDLGVPLPSSGSASKIVFTTRFLDVCGLMNVHEHLRVDCLGADEAWILFEKNLQRGILESDPDIPGLAKRVAGECGGLPLALVTVSRAMSCKKKPEEWRYAIHVLSSSASKFRDLETKVFALLKFSYDHLSSTLRSCLLYCSLFPEDYKIPQRELIDFWISEELLDEYDKNQVYNQGSDLIGQLVCACLLEEGEEKGESFVKMHDVIRDMALWIACKIEKEKENFLVRAGVGLKEAPQISEWEVVRRTSLMENEIKCLSGTPVCPNLQTLFLHHNHLEKIGDDFFQGMPSLKVLNLSYNSALIEVPCGIPNLVSLQHLDLSYNNIKVLPIELKKLVNLKYLGLDYTRDLHTIPPELISSFSMLRVLRMFGCGYLVPTQDVAKDSVLFGGHEFLIEELFHLKNLAVLTLTLRSCYALKRFLLSCDWLQSCTQSLRLQDFDNSKSLNVTTLANFKDLQTLDIYSCESLEELKIEHVGETYRFHSLQSVKIFCCSKLKDLTLLVFAPNLKFLEIFHGDEMEEIISVKKRI